MGFLVAASVMTLAGTGCMRARVQTPAPTPTAGATTAGKTDKPTDGSTTPSTSPTDSPAPAPAPVTPVKPAPAPAPEPSKPVTPVKPAPAPAPAPAPSKPANPAQPAPSAPAPSAPASSSKELTAEEKVLITEVANIYRKLRATVPVAVAMAQSAEDDATAREKALVSANLKDVPEQLRKAITEEVRRALAESKSESSAKGACKLEQSEGKISLGEKCGLNFHSGPVNEKASKVTMAIQATSILAEAKPIEAVVVDVETLENGGRKLSVAINLQKNVGTLQVQGVLPSKAAASKEPVPASGVLQLKVSMTRGEKDMVETSIDGTTAPGIDFIAY